MGFPIRSRTLAVVALVAATASAQPATRRATNIAALIAYPGFYHQRSIVIVGKVATQDSGEVRVADDAGTVRVVSKSGAPDGLDEIRGEFWDVGRMKADDPRFANLDVRATFHIMPDAAWPKTGEMLVIMAAAVTASSPPPAPTIRSIVLNPTRYLDEKVTITGQYAGRNILGDLPDAPAKSRYDFVLRAADAAVWVINMRPKTKDFELALDSRMDSGRWLQVTGTIKQGRGLQWIDAEAGTLAAAKAPADTADTEPPIRVQAAPPPEVIFSAPTQGETDVLQNTSVRIQFSRDLDPTTLKKRVLVRYLESQSRERGEPVTPTAEFTTQYNPAGRVLEIRFAKPLERFRTLKVELLEGILGTDQQPLKPWTLTFDTGGA